MVTAWCKTHPSCLLVLDDAAKRRSERWLHLPTSECPAHWKPRKQGQAVILDCERPQVVTA